MRIPKHIGIIPDGNRRWAKRAGLEKRTATPTASRPGWSYCGWPSRRAFRKSRITDSRPTTAGGLRNKSGRFLKPVQKLWN